MSRTREDIAIIVLRLVLGLVVLAQSFIFSLAVSRPDFLRAMDYPMRSV